MTLLQAEAAVDKFDAPLYTQAEAARFLGQSVSTFRNWLVATARPSAAARSSAPRC